MAVADVAAQLTLWGYRVLVVDMDLEAPGVDEFFSKWSRRSPARGLTDLIGLFKAGQQELDWRTALRAVRLPNTPSGASISVLTAGERDDTYSQRVQSIDWNVLYENGIGRAIERMRADWVREFDFVLVDSRTGVSDTGGICTIQLPDYLIVLFTATHQSVEGVRSIALRAQKQQSKLALDRGRLLVVPIPTRIDQTEYQLREQWHQRIIQRLGHFVAEWTSSKTLVPEIIRQLTVPYVPFWSYGENLPVMTERSREKLGIRFAHETLAALLANELAGVIDLAKNRDAFVREAQRATTNLLHTPLDVFLSYDRAEPKAAAAIAAELERLGVRVWFDKQDAPGGEAWERSLSGAIRDAGSIVVLSGKHQNEWQDYEINEAVRAALIADKKIIPVLTTGVNASTVPLLGQFRGITLRSKESSRVVAQRIAEVLRPKTKKASKNSVASHVSPKAPNRALTRFPSAGQKVASGAHRRVGPKGSRSK
jgi:hypothetical protein